MKTGHLIDAIRRHGFEATVDTDILLLKPEVPDAACPSEAIVDTIPSTRPNCWTCCARCQR